MQIPEALLLEYNATIVTIQKKELLFNAGEICNNYYQVKSGSIKMVSLSEDGKEYIQGIFKSGESFAEPALLGRFPYPASVIGLEHSEIYKCSYHDFLQLLEDHFEIHLQLTKTLGNRLRYKSMMLEELSLQEAQHRILSIIDFHKRKESVSGEFQIPFSRQELADMCGLRVETVIRTIKKLEESGELSISNRKVFRP